MSAEEKIEKIEKIEKTEKTVQNVEFEERAPPNKERFDNLIKSHETEKVATATPPKIEPVTKPSLMDEVRHLNQQVDHLTKASPKNLVAQAEEVVSKIDTIKQKLATQDLALHPQTQTLLQNKLSHIDENLRVAMSKAGLEYNTPESFESKKVNPIERFLGFLTHSQVQLASLSSEINNMHLNKEEISPANMLRIQMKVGYITQEIEFFTAVLNKALESTKTIMNVQV